MYRDIDVFRAMVIVLSSTVDLISNVADSTNVLSANLHLLHFHRNHCLRHSTSPHSNQSQRVPDISSSRVVCRSRHCISGSIWAEGHREAPSKDDINPRHSSLRFGLARMGDVNQNFFLPNSLGLKIQPFPV